MIHKPSKNDLKRKGAKYYVFQMDKEKWIINKQTKQEWDKFVENNRINCVWLKLYGYRVSKLPITKIDYLTKDIRVYEWKDDEQQ